MPENRFIEDKDMEYKKEIYASHNEDCRCKICKEVIEWNKKYPDTTDCMPELTREMRFGN